MKPKVYTASKMKHAQFWRDCVINYNKIEFTARWINYTSEMEVSGSAEDFAVHWSVDEIDVKRSDFVLLYAEPHEILRGALIEAGMGLAFQKTILICGDLSNESFGTWQHHPSVLKFDSLTQALYFVIS